MRYNNCIGDNMNKNRIREMIEKAVPLEIELMWIPRIMERQTASEIAIEATREKNMVGLNGRDAPFVTSIFHQIQDGKHLTIKQIASIKKILPKYAGQYLQMMGRQT